MSYNYRLLYEYPTVLSNRFSTNWNLDPGADPGGGAPPGVRPPKIGKNMIFWRKIMIFHTKYPKNFRASLRLAQFF